MTKLTDTEMQAIRDDIMSELRQEIRALLFQAQHGTQAVQEKEQMIKDIMAAMREEFLDEMRAAGVEAPDRKAQREKEDAIWHA